MCIQESWNKYFQCLTIFKRHILNKHISHNSNKYLRSPINSDFQTPNINEVINDRHGNIAENLDTINVKHWIITLNVFDIGYAMIFIMSLHNNNNFAFKDIFKI